MFKSIQGKVVVIFSLLILFAMQLFGVYLLQGIEEYYLREYSETLLSQGELLASFLRRHLVDEKTEDYIHDLVKGFGSQQGTEIMVLDSFGRVISSNSEDPGLPGKRIVQQEVTRALTGSKSEDLRLIPDTGQRAKYLALPVKEGQNVMGVVYLVGSLENMDNILQQIRLILLTGALLVMIVTASLGIVLARTITRPIQDITARAELMASGDYQQKILVKEEDEIGQLGMMFNYLARQLEETLQEISAEKNKIEAILHNMTDGILAYNHQGRLIHINPAARFMLGNPGGGESDQELGNRFLQQVFPGKGPWDQLEENKPVVKEFSPGGGGERILKAYFDSFKTREGSLTGYLIVFHDITRERQLSRLQQEFVANVSHELRTPLTTVKSYVETLVNGSVKDWALQKNFLQVVEKETERMVRLVQDLLILSQMDYHQVRWKKQWSDLGVLTREACDQVMKDFSENRVTLEVNLPEDLPFLYFDRDRVKQVLLNILNNARQYTSPGGGALLEVQVREETGEVQVALQDTGCGIPPGDLPRIFDRFYRVDKTRSRDHGGTGLGLSIAREIIQAHGGKMFVESTPGKGTRVTFTLPYDLERKDKDHEVPGIA